MPREHIAGKRAAQADECERLVHHQRGGDELVRNRADGTGAHRDDDIAVTRDVAYRRGHIADRFDEHRLDPARDADSTRERTAVGRDDRCFAGRIDVGDHDDVGRRQHMDEILEQVAVRVYRCGWNASTMRRRGKLPRSGERGGHLHRVMSVVVDQRECAAAGERNAAGAGTGGRRP